MPLLGNSLSDSDAPRSPRENTGKLNYQETEILRFRSGSRDDTRSWMRSFLFGSHADFQAGKLAVDTVLWSLGVHRVFVVMANADILLRVSI